MDTENILKLVDEYNELASITGFVCLPREKFNKASEYLEELLEAYIKMMKAMRDKQQSQDKLIEYVDLLEQSREAIDKIFYDGTGSAETKLLKACLGHVHPTLNRMSLEKLKDSLIKADSKIISACADLYPFKPDEADEIRDSIWNSEVTWTLVHKTIPRLKSLKKNVIRHTRRIREDLNDPNLQALSWL